jgi:NADH:ubiquinone oxidoreductase subunit E
MQHASGDKRFKILEVHMKKHQFRHDALIEILHKAQELFGYLEDDLLLFISLQAEAAAQPRLWRGHLLSFLHAQAARRTYVRGLPGHGLLRQRLGQSHRRHRRTG